MIMRRLAILIVTFHLNAAFGFDIPGWDQGAVGYDAISANARNSDAPYIVYFHAEWCPWCKRLNKEFLATREFEDGLKDVGKVAIDPDKNNMNKDLMKKFEAKGYPSFYVVDPHDKTKPVRLSPFYDTVLSPLQFLSKINGVIANMYALRGAEQTKSKDYEKALRSFEKAVAYDKSVQNIFGLAYSYHMKGLGSKMVGDLEFAKLYYRKVLELDPQNAAAKANLGSL